MEKRKYNRVLKFIREWYVIQFVILFCTLELFALHITNVVNVAPTVIWNTPNPKQTAFNIFVYFIASFLWVYLYASFILQKYYNKKTYGRHYRKDHNKTKLDYFSLLSLYSKEAEPHKLDVKDYPIAKWRDIKGLPLVQVGKRCVYVPSDSQTNFTISGAPGCGKTQVAEACANTHKGSCVFVDLKCVSHLNKPTRKIKRFCPEDSNYKNTSVHFNPLRGIKQMPISQQKLALSEMANILIPDDNGSDGNFFNSRARKVFMGIIFLMMSDNEYGENITFPDIVHAILTGNMFDWVNKALNSNNNEALEQLASFYGSSEKNCAGIYDALCSALAPFSNEIFDFLLDDTGDQIGVDMLDEGYDLYIQIKQEHLTAMAPIVTLILNALMKDFMNRPDSASGISARNILVILDEFPQLTFPYDMANTYLSTLRSKNIQIMLIFQSIQQLRYKYKDGANALIGNCNYHLIYKCHDPESRKSYSDLIGKRKVIDVSSNHPTGNQKNSGSKNISIRWEPVFQPEDFGDLNNDVIVYFNGKYIRGNRITTFN